MMVWQRIWAGLTGVQQPPSAELIWLTALIAVAVVAFRPVWRATPRKDWSRTVSAEESPEH